MKKRVMMWVLVATLGCSGCACAGNESPALEPIMPHKALYKVSLVKSKRKAGLQDVSGSMVFDMADACDGWTVHQQMQMRFDFDDGQGDDVNSSIVTWESKEGDVMSFRVKRTSSNKEDEAYKGRANLGGKGGLAHYTYPQDKPDITLSEGTVFPIHHTMMIREMARQGEKLFSRRVFDGSDEEGMAEVSTFIGPHNEKASFDALGENVRNHALIAGKPTWQVRLAFYPPDQQESEPDYEMDMALQENGIARHMVIDYGDFSIAGTLEKIENAAPSGCDGK